jgi:2-iminobutanoate/2-iminopropanoate deaminase
MSTKAIQIPGAPAPIGPYSQAILKNDTLYVSGQIPMDPLSGDLILESVESATQRVMQNIEALLTEAGMDFQNIVKCTIFLRDLNDFNAVNSTYATYFTSAPPARETVQVSRLPKDVPLEISCIAIR